jgi:rod shape determining protein RodA
LESHPGKWWKRSRASSHLNLIQDIDLSILLPTLVLSFIGVAMVYSATHSNAAMSHLYLKQLFWIAIGVMCMVMFASVSYQVLLDRFAWPSYFILMFVLAALLAVGTEIAGSKRWVQLGQFSWQPSEFAKVATVLVLTKFLTARQERMDQWDTLLGAALIAGVPALLILKEPDLGTALVFIGLLFVMLYAAGAPVRRLAGVVVTAVLCSPVIWVLLKDYQRQRVMVFLNPEADTLGAGYNVIQSTIAVGSGRVLGKGWLQGTQGQLRFVPEHHTDFIFSVLAEEWGLIGGVVLLLLFAILLLQALRVARQARDLNGSLIAIGLTTLLSAQVVINLSVAIGLIPVTGMTLPLISYGGSSLLTNLCLIGILLNVWSSRLVR